MLRIHVSRGAAGAKSYFTEGLSREDYYTGEGQSPSWWMGQAAVRLGLTGAVTRSPFAALCENVHPVTGEQLTPRTKLNRRVGYDFCFSCPKSVSILHALTDDARILEAFHASLRETMTDLEKLTQTRVRMGGVSSDRLTGNLVWGEFTHFTARPVDGIPDPHLHAHCYVFNATFDPVEGRWKAAQLGELKTQAPYFEALFLSRLAARLHELGYETETKGRFFELARAPVGLIDKFSRRTQQIEAMATAKGIEDPREKADVGRRTRKQKQAHEHAGTLIEAWRARLTESERAWVGSSRAEGAAAEKSAALGIEPAQGERIRADTRSRPSPTRAAREAIDFALGKSFERSAVVPERILLEEALRFRLGRVSLSELEIELAGRDIIRREVQGKTLVTTREVLTEEERLIAMVQEGRGKFRPLGTAKLEHPGLTAEQTAAVNHVVTSSDFVTIVEGRAGTGKTQLIKTAAAEAASASGRNAVLLAPTTKASRNVLRDAGFKDATTVASFLLDKALQSRAKRGLVWIDEAGLLGTRQLSELLERCAALKARIVLSGDSRQHGSVARGSVLRMLREFGGVNAARVEEVQRQRGEYKKAIELLSRGKTREGFDRLDAMGWIRTPVGMTACRAAAHDYVNTFAAGRSAVLIAPTHREGGAVTRIIRDILKEANWIRRPRPFDKLTSLGWTVEERSRSELYKRGQIIQFHQNARGFRAPSRWVVMGRDPFGNVAVRDGWTVKALPLRHADRFEVYERTSIEIAVGETIRITRNGRVFSRGDPLINEANGKLRIPRHHVHNGCTYRVTNNHGGHLELANGLVLPKEFGHIEYGYCLTSFAAQGQGAERAILYETVESGRAAGTKQFYTSLSRGKESAAVYTDDKQLLRNAVVADEPRMSALELSGPAHRDSAALKAAVKVHERSPRNGNTSRNSSTRDTGDGFERER